MKLQLEVLNMSEFSRRLKRMEGKISDREIKKIIKKASRKMITSAKAKVPKQSHNLAKSIGYLSFRKSPDVFIGVRAGKKYKHDGWYGRFVEFGRAGDNMKKTPFIRPAYDETKAQILAEITAASSTLINNAAS